MGLMVMHPEELTPTERIGLVAYWLTRGEVMTAENVRDQTGYRRVEDAERLLNRLARVLPIYQEKGLWMLCEMREMS